jgi:hypothetical protein
MRFQPTTPWARNRVGGGTHGRTLKDSGQWYRDGVATEPQARSFRKTAEHTLEPTGGDLGLFCLFLRFVWLGTWWISAFVPQSAQLRVRR